MVVFSQSQMGCCVTKRRSSFDALGANFIVHEQEMDECYIESDSCSLSSGTLLLLVMNAILHYPPKDRVTYPYIDEKLS